MDDTGLTNKSHRPEICGRKGAKNKGGKDSKLIEN